MVSVNVKELVPVQWLATPHIAHNFLAALGGYSAEDMAGLAHMLVGYWVDVTNVVDLDEPYGQLVQLASDSQRYTAVPNHIGSFHVSPLPVQAVYVDSGGQCWVDECAFS